LKQRAFITILAYLLTVSFFELYSSDTIYVKNIKGEINVYDQISILVDPEDKFILDSLIGNPVKYKFNNTHFNNKLNFGFSTSTYWIKLVIKNVTDLPADYVLEVSNPDLDHISFYEIFEDSVTKRIETGELHNIRSREILHRNFLFNVSLQPGTIHDYYISANNEGHSFFIPIKLIDKVSFQRTDNKIELTYWLIYGLLLFIILFNIYLYLITKDRVNLYYFLSVIFASLTLFSYDGYLYFFNPPVFIEKIKWIMPSMYIVCLLSFTQMFTNYDARLRWLRKLYNPFKIFSVLAIIFYSLKYPLSLIADIGIPILLLASFILIIIASGSALKKNYAPSVFMFLAFSSIFLGFLINELKELRIISSSILVENSSKFGQILVCVLLAVAVLERFRINQNRDQQTIHDNLLRIALQNKELEIINTELEKLSIVASETDNSIAIYDNSGRLEWCNSCFEKLYEVKINELIKNKKDKIENIIPNKNIDQYVNTCLESKMPAVFETPVVTKSKKVLWIQTTLSPFIRSERIFKIIAIDSDITSLKTYEKELESAKEKAVESDRLKTAFLSNMSHEIRTPLNGIMGFSQLLNGSDLTGDELKSYLEIIRTCGEQLLHIIDDILEISMIESNQLKIFPVEFELNSFVHELMDFFETHKETIGKGHISLVSELEIPDRQFIIKSDPFRLKQVLINLLKNAFKFTKEGQIKIGIYTKKHFLYFYVQDTGISIDPEKKDIIFERFRQGEETLSRKYGGSGLGLSISKGIIEKLGGKIWLDITYKEGFKIFFTIPLALSRKEIEVKEKIQIQNNVEDRIKNKNILIVEDHDISFKYLKEILLPYNPKLTWAVNGREAVNLAGDNQYDLILMDVNLPELDGVTATQEIRKRRPEVPIMIQTAHAIESELVRIRKSGCNDVISKPINIKELLEKLSALL